MTRVRQLVDRLQYGELFQAYLAEGYDGIGQYAVVSLSRGSTTSALRVKVTAGDINLGRPYSAGTPVFVYADRGQLRLLNLGGGSGPVLVYHSETQYDAAEQHDVGLGISGVAGSTGIPSAAAVGTPRLIFLHVRPTGVATGEAFGAARVFPDQFIRPTGILTGAVVGTPTRV